jgi:uncharacterized protein YfbU (UPF0304 family)
LEVLMGDVSPVERLILVNQYRILSAVAPRAAHYEEFIEILERGYEGEYDRVLASVGQNRLSAQDCALVNDTLVMMSWLLHHRRKTNVKLDAFARPGFDAETEHDHLSYARFLFKRAGRREFPGIKEVVDSQGARLERYRSMVKAWRASEDLLELTAADIARILAAGTTSSVVQDPGSPNR